MNISSHKEKAVVVSHLRKRFGSFTAVENFSLNVEEGEFVSLLGPSGCGKTTTLKLLSGLLVQDAGEIRFGGKRVDLLPANKRNIGLVFQNYALFPHMTVSENIAFGLQMRKWKSSHQQKRVDEMLQLVRLEGLGGRKPEQLSGGQQQRVAVARALAFSPDLVLLDEPLSNLDAKLREQVRLDLRQIQREAGQTTVFVTHDQVEAMVMSDRIVLMNGGAIDQIGTPHQIYSEPRTEFGARFVGAGNMLKSEFYSNGNGDFARLDGDISIPIVSKSPLVERDGSAIWCRVRPEDIEVRLDRDALATSALTGHVADMIFQGTTVMVDITVEAIGMIRAERPAAEFGAISLGAEASVHISRAHAVPR